MRTELSNQENKFALEKEEFMHVKITLENRITEITYLLKNEENNNLNWEELELERKA